MLVTPNKLLCDPANEEYYHYGVPVCKIDPIGKTDYENSPRGLAKLDVAISNNFIGDIVNLSQFLNSLEKKGFIYTEPTMVRTRDGRAHNGSLQYTLQPINPLEDAYYERQLREAEARARFNQAMKKFEKKGGKLNEAVNV